MDMDMDMDMDTGMDDIKTVGSMDGEDRLSSLPDEVLIGILCLLPTKDAAATCSLSKRLRLLFSFITTLDLTRPRPHPHPYDLSPAFVAFVHSVLASYHFPYLTTFRLGLSVDFRTIYFSESTSCHDCRDQCLPHLTSSQLHACLSFPFTRCGNTLKDLDLCIHTHSSASYHQLPPAIFMCRSLHTIKLDVNLGLDLLNTISSFSLPNLKLLHLRASLISQPAFVSRLVSTSPALQDLLIEAFWDRLDCLNVSSSSLRRLCLAVFRTAESESHFDDTELVIIDAPNLEDLQYFDETESDHYSIANLDRVAKASIAIENALKVVDHFLRPLSNVKHLCLNGCLTDDLDSAEVMDQLPVFCNLEYLELGCHGYVFWDIVLLAFLSRSPVLQTLAFEEGLVVNVDHDSHREAVELEQEYFRTAQVSNLECCKSHLKRIVIRQYYGDEREIDLIRFLLRHALVLEELVVFPSHRPEVIPNHKSMETTLRNLPKASINSTLLFNC